MAAKLSKTQIDRLGDRLRTGSASEDDLRLLDNYRRTFGEAYETVVRTIREQLKLQPTGRPAKSTSSLIEKLHRESIRLSQVQDIAGCRVVVADVVEQERVVESLSKVFADAAVVDRRANPTYGYRAVHVIPRISGKLIEVQVRTPLQHLWAELSEKLSDVVDPAIKYGGGTTKVREALTINSSAVAEVEAIQKNIARLQKQDVPQQEVKKLRQRVAKIKEQIADGFIEAIFGLED